MVIKKVYDEKTKSERAWYDSTMFFYSKAVEHDNENKVDLFITFKNGWTYKYKDVKLEDYVLLISGYESGSHGKTLNRIIKTKYEFERVDDIPISELQMELDKVIEDEKQQNNKREKTYFISGHRDITDNEFECFYIPQLYYYATEFPDTQFVVGDCDGADIKAQNFLMDEIKIDSSRVTVYHMFDEPRNKNEKINQLIGGFESDDERDSAMTNVSFQDIAFVRDNTKISGTAQNILRRFLMR